MQTDRHSCQKKRRKGKERAVLLLHSSSAIAILVQHLNIIDRSGDATSAASLSPNSDRTEHSSKRSVVGTIIHERTRSASPENLTDMSKEEERGERAGGFDAALANHNGNSCLKHLPIIDRKHDATATASPFSDPLILCVYRSSNRRVAATAAHGEIRNVCLDR